MALYFAGYVIIVMFGAVVAAKRREWFERTENSHRLDHIGR